MKNRFLSIAASFFLGASALIIGNTSNAQSATTPAPTTTTTAAATSGVGDAVSTTFQQFFKVEKYRAENKLRHNDLYMSNNGLEAFVYDREEDVVVRIQRNFTRDIANDDPAAGYVVDGVPRTLSIEKYHDAASISQLNQDRLNGTDFPEVTFDIEFEAHTFNVMNFWYDANPAVEGVGENYVRFDGTGQAFVDFYSGRADEAGSQVVDTFYGTLEVVNNVLTGAETELQTQKQQRDAQRDRDIVEERQRKDQELQDRLDELGLGLSGGDGDSSVGYDPAPVVETAPVVTTAAMYRDQYIQSETLGIQRGTYTDLDPEAARTQRVVREVWDGNTLSVDAVVVDACQYDTTTTINMVDDGTGRMVAVASEEQSPTDAAFNLRYTLKGGKYLFLDSEPVFIGSNQFDMCAYELTFEIDGMPSRNVANIVLEHDV